ncbi:RNA demethylase ALKBH9B isoform X2 [Nymphaea colorata]|uniref:RNA demethylase ALKBH9B isoform X2 n=1 Tax=Nymphaea colorata TaxID=210225 RepID=UPI00129D88B8|nr:RNA demethylase ALKBH9B isoform X2 [Nymphaea colorata]
MAEAPLLSEAGSGDTLGEDHPVERETQLAGEMLARWLPFLSRGLCNHCSRLLMDRANHLLASCSLPPFDEENSLANPSEVAARSYDDGHCTEYPLEEIAYAHEDENWPENLSEPTSPRENSQFPENQSESISPRYNDGHLWESPSKRTSSPQCNDKSPEENSPEAATPPHKDKSLFLAENSAASNTTHMSWADMVQEDELEDLAAVNSRAESSRGTNGEEGPKDVKKPFLSRSRREYLRFMNVGRKTDFICLERVNGKIANILEGLELHTGVFSAAEQKRIVDCIYGLQELGKSGKLKARTYSEPEKWMRGKGRVTIQFGCCYNYAQDKNGNPPGILRQEIADPLPPLFKVMIRRLVGWHVLPPSCIPDSCIVNIYDVGDCIPPHIDHHDFVRPFCTVSFLSECNIIFGTNLKAIGPGEFSGAVAIPLPLGSVLVLNGKGADVAKHCVPGVPSKRKMDDSKRPVGFVPEKDLQDIEPLPYSANQIRRSESDKHRNHENFSGEKERYQGNPFHSGSTRFSGTRSSANRSRGGPRRSRR